MSRNTRTLLTVAAELRAVGSSWASIGKAVHRKAETCQKWPSRYPDDWAEIYRAAQQKRFDETSAEAHGLLKFLMRSDDDRTRHKAVELWLKCGAAAPNFAIVHADPRNRDIVELVTKLAGKVESGFLVGGLTSSRGRNLQVADGVVESGLSGVAFADSVTVATRLTQGCSPVGPKHEITSSQHNVIITLDGRPALQVEIALFESPRIEQMTLIEVGDGRVFAAIGDAPAERIDAYRPWFEAALGSLEITALPRDAWPRRAP